MTACVRDQPRRNVGAKRGALAALIEEKYWRTQEDSNLPQITWAKIPKNRMIQGVLKFIRPSCIAIIRHYRELDL